MYKIRLLGLAMSVFFSCIAFAQQQSDGASEAVSISLDQVNSGMIQTATNEVFHNWVFVGCVHDEHDCAHHAH